MIIVNNNNKVIQLYEILKGKKVIITSFLSSNDKIRKRYINLDKGGANGNSFSLYKNQQSSVFTGLYKRWYGRIREELVPLLDMKNIIAHKEYHLQNGKNRNHLVNMDRIESLYEQYCQLVIKVQEENRKKRLVAGEFAKEKELGHTLQAFDLGHSIKQKLESLNLELTLITEQLQNEIILLPNETHPESPLNGPENNREVEQFGNDINSVNLSKRTFIPKDHVELAKSLDIVDFEASSRTSGAGFYFLKGQGALLENALVQYALSMAIANGFTPIIPPDIVYSKFIKASGFFPRSEEAKSIIPAFIVESDGQQETDSPTKVLAATGEIPLAAYYSGKVLEESQLPIKWVATSHCFRPETGHHGIESRGLYRVHQFTKVELFILKNDNKETSNLALQEIVLLQKKFLNGLGLHCRILNMASEELGASAYQKFDIEAFFPCRQDWGELTSASNCTDYQSRRILLKYRPADRGNLRFAHTLNGTACAIPRIIQAILENHQQADGSVNIPSVLHPFMLDNSKVIAVKQQVKGL